MIPELCEHGEDPKTCSACAGIAILPAWFTERMMTDEWPFGLLLVTGKTLQISSISRVTRDATGALWLDVCAIQSGTYHMDKAQWYTAPFFVPTERTTMSVAVNHVVAAFEMADS